MTLPLRGSIPPQKDIPTSEQSASPVMVIGAIRDADGKLAADRYCCYE